MGQGEIPSKICVTCGRIVEFRKKWEKNWDEVKYCSDRCRKNKKSNHYEQEILNKLKIRGAGKTICPSEVLEDSLKQNKEVMENVRSAARRLVDQGKIIITQNGVRVDPSTAKGPIRLKLV